MWHIGPPPHVPLLGEFWNGKVSRACQKRCALHTMGRNARHERADPAWRTHSFLLVQASARARNCLKCHVFCRVLFQRPELSLSSKCSCHMHDASVSLDFSFTAIVTCFSADAMQSVHHPLCASDCLKGRSPQLLRARIKSCLRQDSSPHRLGSGFALGSNNDGARIWGAKGEGGGGGGWRAKRRVGKMGSAWAVHLWTVIVVGKMGARMSESRSMRWKRREDVIDNCEACCGDEKSA